MTRQLDVKPRHWEQITRLLREHLPGVEVWAYGSRVNGRSHEGSDLDLVLRGPGLAKIGTTQLAEFNEAVQESTIPFLVEARDWARLPESFHREIEREYVVLVEGGKGEVESEWREISLGSITKFLSGGTPSKGRATYWNGSVPWVSAKDMKRFRLYDTEDHVSTEGVRNGTTRVPAGTVLLLVRGMTLLNDVPVCVTKQTMTFNQDVKALRPESGVDDDFLPYLLLGNKRRLLSLVDLAGHGTGRLNSEELRSLDIQLPPLPEQRAIAHILGALDDKIELNRRMNETLEEMARALFKSWFVDFDPVHAKATLRNHTPKHSPRDWTVERAQAYLDGMDPSIAALFPDRFADSELGKIPEGWEVGKLTDTVDQLRDKESPLTSPSASFSHFSIPAYDEGQTPKQELGGSIKSTKTRVRPGVVLLSKLNPEIERVWLVDVSSDDQAVCSTEFLVLRAKPPFHRSYVYCLLRTPLFRQQIKSLVTGTSKSHQRAQAEAVLDLPIVFPPGALIDSFEKVAENFLSKTLNCRSESRHLITLRDTLLPKLISGELRVEDSRRFLESVG